MPALFFRGLKKEVHKAAESVEAVLGEVQVGQVVGCNSATLLQN